MDASNSVSTFQWLKKIRGSLMTSLLRLRTSEQPYYPFLNTPILMSHQLILDGPLATGAVSQEANSHFSSCGKSTSSSKRESL